MPDTVKEEIPSWPAGAVVKQEHLPDAVKKEEIPSWPAGAVVKQEHLSHIVKQEPLSHSEMDLARTPSSRNDRAVRRSRDRDARATADLPRRRETGSCTLITRSETSELIKLESYCRRQARANGEPWQPEWTPPYYVVKAANTGSRAEIAQRNVNRWHRKLTNLARTLYKNSALQALSGKTDGLPAVVRRWEGEAVARVKRITPSLRGYKAGGVPYKCSKCGRDKKAARSVCPGCPGAKRSEPLPSPAPIEQGTPAAPDRDGDGATASDEDGDMAMDQDEAMAPGQGDCAEEGSDGAPSDDCDGALVDDPEQLPAMVRRWEGHAVRAERARRWVG